MTGRSVAVEGDLVQHQALARVEADPERPVLPAHHVAVDGEAGALGLGDLDAACSVVRGGPTYAGSSKLPGSAGTGSTRVSMSSTTSRVDEVDVGDDAVDRVRPAVVRRAVLQERQHAHIRRPSSSG